MGFYNIIYNISIFTFFPNFPFKAFDLPTLNSQLVVLQPDNAWITGSDWHFSSPNLFLVLLISQILCCLPCNLDSERKYKPHLSMSSWQQRRISSVEHHKTAKTEIIKNRTIAKPHTKTPKTAHKNPKNRINRLLVKSSTLTRILFNFWYVCLSVKLHRKKSWKKWQAALSLHQIQAVIYAWIPAYWTTCSSVLVPRCRSCHASNEKFDCTLRKGRNDEQVGELDELAAYLFDSMRHGKSIQHEAMIQEWLWQLKTARSSSKDTYAWGIKDMG